MVVHKSIRKPLPSAQSADLSETVAQDRMTNSGGTKVPQQLRLHSEILPQEQTEELLSVCLSSEAKEQEEQVKIMLSCLEGTRPARATLDHLFCFVLFFVFCFSRQDFSM